METTGEIAAYTCNSCLQAVKNSA